ncbi:MAG: hypothetical protein QGI60_04250 [archaeon]|jgi:hypothetical protein|nr:hypothetical protein [archaeon]
MPKQKFHRPRNAPGTGRQSTRNRGGGKRQAPVIIPKIVAGRKGQRHQITFNPATNRFIVAGEEFVFERRDSKLTLFRVVGGKKDPSNWIAADLLVVLGEKDRKLESETIDGKKIHLSSIGIMSNRSNLLETDGRRPFGERRVLPLFLSYLTLKGATHAYARAPNIRTYYEQNGYGWNPRVNAFEKALPRMP